MLARSTTSALPTLLTSRRRTTTWPPRSMRPWRARPSTYSSHSLMDVRFSTRSHEHIVNNLISHPSSIRPMFIPDEIPRRSFLRTMSLGTTLIGAGSLLEGCAPQAPLLHEAARTSPLAAPRRTTWDMSWVARLTRPHRVVFDVTKISDGDALWQTTSWMQGYADAEGATDADLNAVLVFRHGAVAMVLSDAMWARLDPGGARPTQPAATTPPSNNTTATKRNPYLGDTSAPP